MRAFAAIAIPGRGGAGAQAVADDGLEAADIGLGASAQIIAALPLPLHAALLGDGGDMAVALGRRGFAGLAQDRTGARRHDDGRVRVMLAHRVIDPVLIIGSVTGEGGERPHPVQHGHGMGAVIDLLLGQLGCDDLAAFAVEGEMQLTPCAPLRAAMLFDQPFARTAELQPGAVDQ